MHRLNLRGVFTIGDLARTDPTLLCEWLGSSGAELYRYANGLDDNPVQNYGIETALKSISNSSTPPHDICCAGDALRMLQSLGENVAARLRKHKLKAGVVVLHVRDSTLSTFERQVRLPRPSCLSIELRDAAFNLLCENYDWKRPIRSLGIRACGLVSANEPIQLCLFDDYEQTDRQLKIEKLPTSYAKIRQRQFCSRHVSINTGNFFHAGKKIQSASPNSVSFRQSKRNDELHLEPLLAKTACGMSFGMMRVSPSVRMKTSTPTVNRPVPSSTVTIASPPAACVEISSFLSKENKVMLTRLF